MKFNQFLFGVALCTAASFVSCKKNDMTNETPVMFPDRSVNGVVADDPALMAKVPMIISTNYLASQIQGLYTAQAKRPSAPPKGPKTTTADITAPSVIITSPANGSSYTSGVTLFISISASDETGISSETFSVDGVLKNSVAGATSGFSWNTSGVGSGTHTLTVTATDVAGNTGYASIVVTINSTIITPPPSPSPAFQIAMPPVTSQGSEGSCVSFAIGYYLRSAEHYYQTGATSYSHSSNIVSPEYLFNQTKSDPSNCTGSTLLAALNLLKSNGVCTWQSMPYSSSNGCSLMPTTEQNAEAANYKITNYSTLYTSDMSTVKALLNAKHPLYISFNVDSYFYYAGPGFIWKSFSGTFYGQHAVVICGYDDAKHAYKVVNSWGAGWGDSGYSWIDYDFLPQVSSLAVTVTL